MNCTTRWLEAVPASRLEKATKELGSIGEQVSCVVAHPKHDAVLLGTSSGKVVAFDPTQGSITQSVQAHNRDVTRIVFSPDASHLFTSSIDGKVHEWDQQFIRQRSFTSSGPVYCVAVSPDSKRVAAGGEDKTIRVFDIESDNLLHTLSGHTDTVTAVAWVSDKMIVSAGSEGHLWVWEVEYNRSIRHMRAHQKQVSQLILSNDRSWYATASWDQVVKVWSMQHRERFAFPAAGQAIMSVALSDDDQYLAVGYWDGVVRLWRVDSGKLFDEFRAHPSALVGCVPLAGSRFWVTVEQQGSLRSWDFAEMGLTRYLNRHNGEVFAVSYTPDAANVLSVGFDTQLKAWDKNDRIEIGYIESQSGPVTSVAVAPDNRYWAIGTANGNIKIWDVDEQAFDINLPAHKDDVSALKFTPDGKYLVSGSWDVKLKIWSMETRKLESTFDGHNKEITGCDISADARRMISSSWDRSAKVWDLTNLDRQFINPALSLDGHTDRVMCCAISPSGARAATGSTDGTIRFWNLDRLEEPRVMLGHTAEVTGCSFSPDGLLLLSVDRNGAVQVWDAIEEHNIGSLRHDQPLLCIDMSPDGTQAVVGDEAGQLRFIALEYQVGPAWIVPRSIFKQPSFWKRGAPPTETFEVMCIQCGKTNPIKNETLGAKWKCPSCGLVARIFPRGMLVR